VKVNFPLAFGIPDNTPVGDKVRPAGRRPRITDQVYGPSPPTAVKACLYEVPRDADGKTFPEVISNCTAGKRGISRRAGCVSVGTFRFNWGTANGLVGGASICCANAEAQMPTAAITKILATQNRETVIKILNKLSSQPSY
jgi:hypothetical protein